MFMLFWQEMVKDWVTSHGRHPILVDKYEDLERDTSFQGNEVHSDLSQDAQGRSY